MFKKLVAEYGSWISAIDATIVNGGNCKAICELQCNEESVFWIEQQFPTGRRTIFEAKIDSDEEIREWTPPEFNIRNAVHEYGGGSFIVVDNSIYLSTAHGIFHQKSHDTEPELIIAGDHGHRFADLCFHNDFLYSVYEVHSGDEVSNMIVRIKDALIEPMVSGADFYAYPRVSPNGAMFSWMEWNMPNMPWDDTTIRVATLNDSGKIDEVILELSREGINLHCAEWTPNSELMVVCDQTNYWNVYKVDLDAKRLGDNVHPVWSEIGEPLWQFAGRQYATNMKGILMNNRGKLQFKDWDGQIQSVELSDYCNFKCLAINKNNFGFAIASGPRTASSVIQIDLNSMKSLKFRAKTIREARSTEEIKTYDISQPEAVYFTTGQNELTHAWFYPPFSSKYKAPEGTLPPAVLIAHGGPTASSDKSLDMRVQYLTSRGFAVCDVNYHGSTGFGTAYRKSLYSNWGILDRNDMINAAKYIAKYRLADPKRLCIMGSSAGGFLVLVTLMHSKLFAAGASIYGVADLIGLAKETHKFELGYNEQLLGKYPEKKQIYEERSPINHVNDLNTPVVFFHGAEDPVVPLSQSVALHNALLEKGILTALTVFPDECHGFKSSLAQKTTLDGVYYFFCKVLGIKPSVKSEIKIENLQEVAQEE